MAHLGDVIEHLHHTLPLMQELHRVPKPGAKAVIRVPHGASDDAWEDPTHLRGYFQSSSGYFSQQFYWRADYHYRGDGRWRRCI
jgi:SAM-dependent methyltransferase